VSERPRVHLGVLALAAAAAGLGSGVFLAFHYAPTLDDARNSVAFLQTRVHLGGFLRGVHFWAGHVAVGLAALHGLVSFWRGRHRGVEPARGRGRWVLGGLLFLVIVGFAYTGYLLPADARARTGIDIMLGVAGSTPGVGADAAAVLRGGAEVSSATLVRLYAVHAFVLPAAFFALLLALAARGRLLTVPNALGSIAVLGLLAVLAGLYPAPLGRAFDPELGAEGKPEWFLLWVNELLHRFGGRPFVVGAVVPGALIALALLAPWLPRAPRAGRAFAVLLLAGLGALTGLAAAREEPARELPAETEPEKAQDGDVPGVEPIFETFRCRKCHIIDDDPDGGDSGPPLHRRGTRDLPSFDELYTRAFFRRKVADPEALWADTGMYYPKRAGLPTADQVAALERWFFEAK